MERYLIVATPAELALVSRDEIRSRHLIITGVGGTNVIQKVKNLPTNSDVLNVGYAGSSYFPVGSIVHVGSTKLFHPNVKFDEQTFLLGSESALCLTAGDFVINGKDLPEKSVVDMELAYIAAFGFKKLKAVKVISDACDLTQYKSKIQDNNGNKENHSQENGCEAEDCIRLQES